MALSMDEQRVLAEIERRLSAEDPGLAACMTNFRRPGPAAVLRSPRGRIIGSLFTVLVVAMISLMVYAMIPFRGHITRPPSTHQGVSGNIAATGTSSHGAVTIAASGGTHAKTATAGSAAANRTAASKASPSTKTGAAARSGTTSSHPDQVRAKSSGS